MYMFYIYCSLVLTLHPLVPRGQGGLAALAPQHATTGLGHHDGSLQGLQKVERLRNVKNHLESKIKIGTVLHLGTECY